MGAAPRLALLSMVLPPSLPLADFDAIAAGFAALAVRHRLHLVGGNLTRSPGPLMLDVTVMGTVKRRQALTRRGARPGDDLYVTGTIGAAAAGLRMLQEVIGRQSSVAGEQSLVAALSRPASDNGLMTAYLRPNPRVRIGSLVSRTRSATACMDLSDGLADAAHQIAEASGVGITIDAAALPIDPAARAFFEARGLDAIAEAVTGGDDYELLIASRPRWQRRLAAAASHGGVALTRVGRCTADRAIVLHRADTGTQSLPQGYSHFARAPLAGLEASRADSDHVSRGTKGSRPDA
jgi:thiamine-monophosphate kinase